MNHFKSFNLLFLSLITLLFLPACVKYYEFSDEEFPQGNTRDINYNVVSENIRSRKFLNEFSTEAIFDVLHMSDCMRQAYTKVYCEKHGENEEFKTAMLRRQLEENRHWVTFYVLSDLTNMDDKQIDDKDTNWSFFLKLPNGETITPLSIKEVELPAEIKYFFGHRVSDFTTPYVIKFPASKLNAIKEKNKKETFKMVISGVRKYTEIAFGQKDVSKYCDKWKGRRDDFYWIGS